MRVLYIDIDSLRPDHLGCYGYHRATSPNIDRIAAQAVRFDHVFISDAPCLPSRTALWSGRTGFHTGLVSHGGTAGQPRVHGPSRGWRDLFGDSGWMYALRQVGLRTVTISSFGERHGAWHWYADFNEIYNPGLRGMDRADEVVPLAIDWLDRNGQADNWFLHVNVWDPHTPYRTPLDFGNPFANDPLPAWMTESVRQAGWNGHGPHSAQEVNGYGTEDFRSQYPRHPNQIDSMAAVREWFDGYDVGVRYADEWLGRLFDRMTDLGIFDDTIIVISADHAENMGELNVWGDHATACAVTCRVPLIIRYPGLTDTPRVDTGLYQHFDWAATLIDLLGGSVPSNWDARSFAEAFRAGQSAARPYVTTSQGLWSVQRGIRFAYDGTAYMALLTYHDGHKMLDPVMLFDLDADPHEQVNLADARPHVMNQGLRYLTEWQREQMLTSLFDVDPLMTVLREGGPFHTRGELPAYIERLKATGRAQHAATLAQRHPDELIVPTQF